MCFGSRFCEHRRDHNSLQRRAMEGPNWLRCRPYYWSPLAEFNLWLHNQSNPELTELNLIRLHGNPCQGQPPRLDSDDDSSLKYNSCISSVADIAWMQWQQFQEWRQQQPRPTSVRTRIYSPRLYCSQQELREEAIVSLTRRRALFNEHPKNSKKGAGWISEVQFQETKGK